MMLQKKNTVVAVVVVEESLDAQWNLIMMFCFLSSVFFLNRLLLFFSFTRKRATSHCEKSKRIKADYVSHTNLQCLLISYKPETTEKRTNKA